MFPHELGYFWRSKAFIPHVQTNPGPELKNVNPKVWSSKFSIRFPTTLHCQHPPSTTSSPLTQAYPFSPPAKRWLISSEVDGYSSLTHFEIVGHRCRDPTWTYGYLVQNEEM